MNEPDRPGLDATAGRQDPVFAGGNRYLSEKFPLLDYIKSARVSRQPRLDR